MKAKIKESNPKFKIGLSILITLCLLLLIANWIIGNMIEDELAQNIEQTIAQREENIDFDYDQLQVNPILAQVSFKNGAVKLDDSNAVVNMNWDEVVYKGGYRDLFNLLSEEETQINKIHTLKTDFDNLEIAGEIKGEEKFDFVFSFGQLGLDFDGLLSREELNNNPEEILNHNHQFEFSGANFEIDFPILFEQILINSNLQEKLLTLNKINLDLNYRADNKTITVEQTVDTSNSSSQLDGDIKLVGPTVEELTGIKLDLKSDGEYEVENLRWGQANKTGKYTIDKLYGRSEFEIDRIINIANDSGPPAMIVGDSNYDFNLEGLQVEVAGGVKEKLKTNPLVMMTGIDINQIMINSLNLNYQTSDQQIKIEQGKLDSSLVDANIRADLKLNDQYPNLSKINDFKVELSNFTGNLRNLFETMETRMGVSLPRDGDAIVLEMKGTFAQPQIKGLHY
jgi:hypothetical protein